MNIKIDIKRDCAFKNIFLRESGKKYICSIISELLNIDYKDLLNNIKIYNTEHPRENIKLKSSYSDIIYEYKNKLFIIEMNYIFSKKMIHKNYFYLLFRHIFDATSKNNYNENRETYLIDIDNFDIVDKMKINVENKFIYKSLFHIEKEIESFYKNIKTYRINLDYLNKRKYNCNKLTNIERDCLIFVESNKNILRNSINNRYLEGVIEMLEVMEIDGKFYPVYNKEEWDKEVMEDAIQNEKELARIDGHEEGKKAGIKEGIKEGIKTGRKEGLQEGKLEGITLIAKKLKKDNYPLKEIMYITGLTKEQIKML